MENGKKPTVNPQIADFLLKQFKVNLNSLEEILQKKWFGISEIYIGITNCRAVEAALFRIDVQEKEEEEFKKFKDDFFEKTKEFLKNTNQNNAREWCFIFYITNESLKNFKKEVRENFIREEVLPWWKKFNSLSLKNLKKSRS